MTGPSVACACRWPLLRVAAVALLTCCWGCSDNGRPAARAANDIQMSNGQSDGSTAGDGAQDATDPSTDTGTGSATDPADAGHAGQPDSGSRPDATDPDSGAAVTHDFTLCNGSDEVTLIVQEGFRERWPQSVLYERGGRTFLLDGRCNLYLQNGPWDPVHVRALTTQEMEALAADLELSAWSDLASGYCHSLGSDEPTFRIWLSGLSLEPRDCSPMADPNPRLLTNFYRRDHYAEGQPVTGPVRYVLVEDTTGPPASYIANAAPWPLGDVAAAASQQTWNASLSEAEQQAEVRVAEGADAEALRALRTRYLAGSLGDTGSQFVPIRQPDGTLYRLYLRDSLAFEGPNGAIPLPTQP